MSKVEFLDSVLCSRCSNAGPGVKIPGESVCQDCIADDVDLLRRVVHLVMPDMAARLEDAIAKGLKQ